LSDLCLFGISCFRKRGARYRKDTIDFLATRERFLADDFAAVFFVAVAAFLAVDFFLGAALFALGFRRIVFFALGVKEEMASLIAVLALAAALVVAPSPAAATFNPAFAAPFVTSRLAAATSNPAFAAPVVASSPAAAISSPVLAVSTMAFLAAGK
jgi:hypothetical protein